ncbi:MAG: nicotinate phosphoribosyltransferase [Fusobacteriaceae bacterium]
MQKEVILDEFAKVINSDRYQYTESDVLLAEGFQEKESVFDMFFRSTEDGGFAVVSGVQEVIYLIEVLNDTSSEIKRKYFEKVIKEKKLVEYLVNMKFTGSVFAMRDGEIAYPNEPIITIKAPLIQAKILETPILNIMNMQMAIATKASRITRAAYPTDVLAFGSRRAHGFDSAVAGNKAAIIGGCATHSNLATEYKYSLPSVGTMSHSYIQTFGVGKSSEKLAFDAFIKCRRKREANSLFLLIDTYSTLKIGIINAIAAFKDAGIDDNYNGNYGIRIDSGDLAYLSKKVRRELDLAGFLKAKIILTNSLNEDVIKALKEQGAAVDIYGVGDAIAVSKSNPCFGGVYKIVEIDHEPVIKLSEDVIKISNPGFKEVYRIYDKNGEAYADLITLILGDKDTQKLEIGEDIFLRDEKFEFTNSTVFKGEYTYKKLSIEFVKNGEITEDYWKLLDINRSKNYYLSNLEKISPERKRLENPHKYKVNLSLDMIELKYNLIKKLKKEILDI